MGTFQDLIDEAKVRFVWWGTCIFAISYFFSHTSKSMWMNLPISILLAFALRVLMIRVEFHWKHPPSRVHNYLFYLEKKQVRVGDSRLSTSPSPRKWKRKIDSPSVQAAVEEFIDLIVRDFVVDLWYAGITPDKEAPELIRGIVLDAIGEVAGRIKEVNLVGLLTRDMIDLVGDHIEMYRRNQTFIGVDVMGTLSSEERDERLKHHLMSSKQLHPALVSPESEHKFLQQLMGGVIALVLRQKEVQCPLVRCIARELLTCLVIQPLIKLASPMYINELIEHVILNNKPKTEGGDDESSKTHNCCSVPSQESEVLSLDKVGSLRENAPEVLDCLSFTSNGGTTQQKTADWARILDAASKRRTEVLAPDNLENMWARGRNYKVKLNSAAKVHHAYGTKDLASLVIPSSDIQKLGSDNKVESPRIDDKATMQFPQSSSYTNEPEHSGAMMEDNVASPRAGVVKKISLKKSISTSSLKNEPIDRKANSYETKGIAISEEYYGPDYGKHSMELQYKGSPDTPRAMIQAEGFHYPRLRCRVIGAYFEKIGSKSFAVYSIAVTDLENKTWFVKRRYRNFERLHRHLKDIPNYTLHLPPKRIFSSSTEDAFVHQRCIQLDKYLQDLLSIANVAEQHEVWDFLSVSSKNYSFGKSSSVMSTLAVNVDEAVDDIMRQFKGVSDGLMRKVVGSSPSYRESVQRAPFRSLSWNAREVRSQCSGHNSIERSNSSTDDEDVSITPAHRELSTSAEASVCHSDSEFDARDFDQHIVKQIEATKSLDMGKYGLEPKSECMDRDHATSLPSTSSNSEDPVGVPPEWSPPNVTVPALNLVDKIFQLNRRGWLRRQVFWMSKQILQLAMEDAIDDWILGQLSCLRRDDVIAQGIGWIKDTLWPEGKFFKNLQNSSGESDDMELDHTSSEPNVCLSGSFETQLEAARRASEVKKLLFNGAPTALVSLVGQKQYKRCARDIYYFLQSSICIKQLVYGAVELTMVSVFPELKDVVMDIHKKMDHHPSPA